MLGKVFAAASCSHYPRVRLLLLQALEKVAYAGSLGLLTTERRSNNLIPIVLGNHQQCPGGNLDNPEPAISFSWEEYVFSKT